MTAIPPIPGHHLMLVLLQIALLLTAARLLGELSKRLDQPSVIGELLAGIVLGPSVLGWFAPGVLATIFPRDAAQFHLLELLGWLGMVLLMLLTGLETDVRRLKHLGRAALSSSVMGMLIPGALGCAFAWLLPDRLLANPGQRGLFAAFVATAMAISAMPIIAKVLRDLDLNGRDLGLLILTAGVLDDTVGWLVLSVIAALVSERFSALRFAQTLGFTVGFVALAAVVLYPVSRWLFRFVGDRFRSRDNDLALTVILGFASAAATEAMGVHAVFGAFVTGCVLRQVPRLKHASLARLESVVLAIFAPLFFGLVGLKVDLHTLVGGGGLALFLVALAVATTGKVVGCTIGGLAGGLGLWESLSVGVGMNARGAMGLVVALIGLQLGILTPTVYAVLVLVAITTTFMAPVGLRLTLKRVAVSDEERERMAAGHAEGLFQPASLQALLVTAGGPNALAAGRLISSLLGGADASLSALFVDAPRPRRARLTARLGALQPAPHGSGMPEHIGRLRRLVERRGARFEALREAGHPAEVVAREAARQIDVVALGVSRTGDALGAPLLAELLRKPPAHLVLVRAEPLDDAPDPASSPDAPPTKKGRVLAFSDGSYASRAAVELALLHAESVGAELTVMHVLEPDALGGDDLPPDALDENFRRMLGTTLMDSTTPLLAKSRAKVRALVESANPVQPPLLREARSGDYDLVVLGAEHRALQNRLSVGYEVERVIARATCAAAVVVPRIGE